MRPFTRLAYSSYSENLVGRVREGAQVLAVGNTLVELKLSSGGFAYPQGGMASEPVKKLSTIPHYHLYYKD